MEKNFIYSDRGIAVTVSYNEGQSVPGIAHGVIVEHV